MRRPLCAVVAAIAVVATAACGSSGKPSPNAAGSNGPAASASATASGSAAPASGAPSSGRPNGGTPASAASGSGSGQSAAPGGTGAKPAASATPNAVTSDGSIHPSHVATEKDIPIEAAVTPKCVVAGTTATLSVTTHPKASLGFVAVYNGEKSGAAPPFGEGHGGNDKGETDFRGKWSNTWTVALTAPSGPARVILVVAYKGKQRSIDVPFSVSGREAGGCGT